MHIKIAERLKPYSHVPGTSCLLPGTSLQVQVFPTRLRFYDLIESPKLLEEITFDLEGPLQDFTIQNDLEKGEVRVWGVCRSGLMRYSLNSCANGTGVRMKFERTPSHDIQVTVKSKVMTQTVRTGESIALFQAEFSAPIADDELFRPPLIDRLSLGNHKAQDCELIRRRLDLTEIFPILHRLGQLVKAPVDRHEGAGMSGTLALLQACQTEILEGQPEHLACLWSNLYQASFHGIMVPRLWDDQYQGIISEQEPVEIESSISPLVLIAEAARLIRRHFIEETEAGINILPKLPPEFHSGRLLGVQLDQAVVSLEWTKKVIRRLEVEVKQDAEMIFHFRHVKRFRLRKGKKEKGVWVQSGAVMHLEKNNCYFLDNFS